MLMSIGIESNKEIIMKQIEYKGYIINLTKHPEKEQPYYAEVNGEGHWNSTEDGAVNLVKAYIDALPTLREMSFPPMKPYEIEAIKRVFKRENTTFFIKRQLITNHYVLSNGKVYIDPKFIYHHADELEKLLLEEEGYEVHLMGDEYHIGNRSYFFAYDADVFKTERSLYELKCELYKKQMEEE